MLQRDHDQERLRSLGALRRTVSPIATLAFGGIGLACVLVVTACGSKSAAPASSTTGTSTASGTSTTGTTTTGTSTTAAGSFAAYQSCLQAHGMTFPGGLGRGGGPTGSTGPTGSIATGGPTGPTGNGVQPGRGGRLRLTAAQRKAQAACASLRPTGVPGGGGGFGAGGVNSNNPAFAKFQACLKQHGVQTGTTGPAGPGGQPASPDSQSAFAACRSLLPAGSFGGGNAGGSVGAPSSTFAKFQACLKEHGGGTGASSATTQAAIAACRSLLPNGGNSSPGTTTTG